MSNIDMMEVTEGVDQMNDFSKPIEIQYPKECIEDAEQLDLEQLQDEYPDVAEYVKGMEDRLGASDQPGSIMSTIEYYRTDDGSLIARCSEEKTEACGQESDFWRNTMMVMKGDDVYAQRGGTENSSPFNEFLNSRELMPNKVYHIDGFINYKTDELGRVCEVEARPTDTADVEKPGKRPPSLGNITKDKDGLDTDDGGHLIAKELYGSYDAINIVPQDSALNNGKWKSMEKEIRDAVGEGQDVTIHQRVEYGESDSFRPQSFHVEVTIDGKMKTYDFENKVTKAC